MKEFKLGAHSVEVKDLTVGDLITIQKLMKDLDEIEQPRAMICYCTGLSEESFNNLSLKALGDIETLSNYIGDMIEGK